MTNHPYKRRKLLGNLKPAKAEFDEHLTDMQGPEGVRHEDGHCAGATSPDHERRAKYELHETPKPVIVKRKRR
jgi:hypothetical protein